MILPCQNPFATVIVVTGREQKKTLNLSKHMYFNFYMILV